MSYSFAGKTVIITGGTKGIGRAVAELLSSRGANLVLSYGSDDAAAAEVVQKLGVERTLVVKADSGSLQDNEKLVAAAVKRFSQIDVLIPNAAIMPMRTLKDIDEDIYNKMFDVNVKGPLFLVQKTVPHMPKGSHIVFFSSTGTAVPTIAPDYLLYAMTKGAIEQATKLLSKDLSKPETGIAVNCIAPGPTGTELFYHGKSEELIANIGKTNPHGRIGTPDEVADVVAFLSGPESRWMTGQLVRVNGGMA